MRSLGHGLTGSCTLRRAFITSYPPESLDDNDNSNDGNQLESSWTTIKDGDEWL